VQAPITPMLRDRIEEWLGQLSFWVLVVAIIASLFNGHYLLALILWVFSTVITFYIGPHIFMFVGLILGATILVAISPFLWLYQKINRSKVNMVEGIIKDLFIFFKDGKSKNIVDVDVESTKIESNEANDEVIINEEFDPALLEMSLLRETQNNLNLLNLQLQEIKFKTLNKTIKLQELRDKEKNRMQKLGMTEELKILSDMFLISSGDLLIEMGKIGIYKVNESDSVNSDELKIIIKHLADNGNDSAQQLESIIFFNEEENPKTNNNDDIPF